MLHAYFDDSGTHDGSDLVLLAGLLGNEAQWSIFEFEWRKKLNSPVPGRKGIKRFHMVDCESAEGEFIGWSRAERDLAIHDFRQIIVERKFWGFVHAVQRRHWDRIITGKLRVAYGDAERFCLKMSLLFLIHWLKEHSADKDCAVAFDDRPHREALHSRVIEVEGEIAEAHREYGQLVAYAFLRSEESTPLQAADMVAWEFHRDIKRWMQHGTSKKPRPHFLSLTDSRRFTVHVGDAEKISQIAARPIGAIEWGAYKRLFGTEDGLERRSWSQSSTAT